MKLAPASKRMKTVSAPATSSSSSSAAFRHIIIPGPSPTVKQWQPGLLNVRDLEATENEVQGGIGAASNESVNC